MDLNNLKLFKLAETRMDWATQRQRILSQNISNADTHLPNLGESMLVGGVSF